jgi:hypothetical protein
LIIDSQPDFGSRVSVTFPQNAVCRDVREATAAA